jgi:hypothetical protein
MYQKKQELFFYAFKLVNSKTCNIKTTDNHYSNITLLLQFYIITYNVAQMIGIRSLDLKLSALL